MIAKNIVRITEERMLSHPSICLVTMAALFQISLFATPLTGQDQSSSLPTEDEVSQTIKSYRTNDAAKSVELFRKSMPPPVLDAAFRKKIIDDLPEYVPRLRIDRGPLIEKVTRLVGPILKVYGREPVYEIIIIDHDTPLVMSDSGVVLVITTGTFLEVANDDEFLHWNGL